MTIADAAFIYGTAGTLAAVLYLRSCGRAPWWPAEWRAAGLVALTWPVAGLLVLVRAYGRVVGVK